MQTTYLHIGGLVGVGFDQSGQYLLTVSHSGRGVFRMSDWVRVARDSELAYPKDGRVIGIGPIDGESILVTELDSEHPITVPVPGLQRMLHCESSGIMVTPSNPG